MARGKKLIGLCLFMLALLPFLPAAQAGARLFPNGSVQYLRVAGAEGLRAYIDANGSYSSQDSLGKGGQQYGNTYKIILDEPGDLLLYPLSFEAGARLELYGDFALKNSLLSMGVLESSREKPYRYPAQAGTYYYRVENHAAPAARVTVYAGFVPANPVSAAEPSSQWARDKSSAKAVPYALVNSADQLAEFIHRDMAPASLDTVENSQPTPHYQITVDQPGLLVFAPLKEGGFGSLQVYSNAALTSRLLRAEMVVGTHEGFPGLPVEPGTYYYDCRDELNAFKTTMAVYVGFIPGYGQPGFLEGRVASSFIQSMAKKPGAVEAVPSPVADAASFLAGLDKAKPVLRDKVSGERQGKLARLELPEGGLLLLAARGNSYSTARLYNNAALTSRLLDFNVDLSTTRFQVHPIYLDKGVYYYRVGSDFSSKFNVDTYLGFIPASSVLKVRGITLGSGETSAEVAFDLHDAYNPDSYRALVRVVPGVVGARSLNDPRAWGESNNSNALEGRVFTAIRNGVYTARVAGTGLQSYLAVFEVSGIREQALPAPAPITETPPTAVPPTKAPDTPVPPTEIPVTPPPRTEAPPTAVPATPVPPTQAPPTQAPATPAQTTVVPPAETPGTTASPNSDEYNLAEAVAYILRLEGIAREHGLLKEPEDLYTMEALAVYMQKLETSLDSHGIDY